jgi:tryptophanyl-tRNA synthetase
MTSTLTRHRAVSQARGAVAAGASAGPATPEGTLSATVSGSLAAAQRRSAEIERRIGEEPSRFRILTGDRPTGDLHLGHYFGTLRNRVRLQDAGAELFVLIADYQVLTDRDAAGAIGEHVLSLVLDYLATGVDPARSVIFAHSAVPELNQLLLPFLSLVTAGELQRNPTVKDEIAHSRQRSPGGAQRPRGAHQTASPLGTPQTPMARTPRGMSDDSASRGTPPDPRAIISDMRSVSGLMLTYPVHQAADILACQGNLVPVGQDQLPHVEVTRLIARRFNDRYPGAGGARVFPEPDALLSDAPLLLGTDGGKMSKSRGNAIALRASADETARLIRGAKTDGVRHVSYDPATRPEVSSLVLLAALCLDRDPVAVAGEIGGGGAALLKRTVTDAVNERFAPVRARRAELAGDPGYARQVLRDGCARARAVAAATLEEVRDATGMRY